MRVVAALLLLASAGCTTLEKPDIEGRFRLRDVRVVRVSPRPAFGSGTVLVWADFDVRERSGRRRRMYMLYFGEQQFIPPLGSRCDIVFELRPIGEGERRPIGNAVREIACDTGRWPDHAERARSNVGG